MISFVHLGEPVPAARPRVTARGTFTPEPYRNYKVNLAAALRSTFADWVAMVPPTTLPSARRKWLKENEYLLKLHVYCSTRRGDITNFLKGVEDAIQDAGIVANDSQIIGVCAFKYQSKNPRIEFTLERIH